jgi:hypothetical protein
MHASWTISKLLGCLSIAASLLVASQPNSAHAAASPWGRAIGEAVELQRATKDLHKRVTRSYPSSPAAPLACAIDEAACGLVEMIKCGAQFVHLQVALQDFQALQFRLNHAIAQDCRLHSDRSLERTIKVINDRYRYLVTDLSKCRLPTIGYCPPHSHSPNPLPTYSNPWGDPNALGFEQPTIPEIYRTRPVAPMGTQPPITIPGYQPSAPVYGDPNEPRYWQGSIPVPNNAPRSTYDFESVPIDPSQRDPRYPMAISSQRPSQATSARPLAADILALLLQRAASQSAQR